MYVEGRETNEYYVGEDDRVLYDDTLALIGSRGVPLEDLPTFESGGPRDKVFFDPATTKVGVVTCGGLCPGLNDVIRAIVLELHTHYGVRDVVGFQHGYAGLIAANGHNVIELTPDYVSRINERGGTILGSSRGAQDPVAIVDRLVELDIDILMVIGGDGSMRGACNICTAFAKAAESIKAARVEVEAAVGGVGIVKVMGRHAGFIACYAALANHDADFVLIPEVDFALDGDNDLLALLERRVADRGSAVIVLAEGAG